MAVIIAPAPDDRVETLDQDVLPQACAGSQNVPSLFFDRCDTGFSRFDEQFSAILAQVEAEEIEPLVDVHDVGLRLGQLQTSFPEELLHQGFDLLGQ